MMQGDLVLENAIAYTPQKKLDNAVVAVERGKVRFVGPAGSFEAPEGTPTVDLDGDILTPGFIDLQHNGAFGFDFTENPERIWDVAAGLTRYGVTSFLPTIITSPLETIAHAQAVLREGSPKGFLGTTPLGLHIEGPFLNPINKGAHDPEYLRLPDREEYRDLRPENGVRMVTLAPELPGAETVIRMLVDRGVLVSAGHSAATFDEMQKALDWGVRYATHLFNAMAPLHHHHPGLVGALLHDPRATVGIIADLVHLHPAILKMIFKTVPPGRINLVSDAMSAFGMPDGSHRLSNQVVEVQGMVVRHPSGVLAGSVLSLDQALRNVLAVIGCELETVLPMVTSIPACLLSMQDEIGSLTPGMRGDLVVLDKNLNVRKTIIAGRIVYET